MKKRSVWSFCWKCEGPIYSQADCNYLKSRDGNYNFCPTCYTDFLQASAQFIRPERSKREELKRSLNIAMSDFHDKMEEEGVPIRPGHDNHPTFLIHEEGFWGDCDACREILSMRCSEQCGNMLREVQ